MKIEAGKRYRTRDGRVTGPVAWMEGVASEQPFIAIVDGYPQLFCRDGSWFRSGVTHCFDLVEEYEEHPFRLEAGKQYVTRDGIISGPVRDRGPGLTFRYAAVICDSERYFREDGIWSVSGEHRDIDLIREYVPSPEPAEPTPEKTEPPFRLEVGKRYVTRDGRVSTPIEENPRDPTYKYKALVSKLPWTYQVDGAWTGPTEPHRLDLVREYVESPIQTQVADPKPPEPTPEQAETKQPFHLEVGKRYVTRDGRLSGPIESTVPAIAMFRYAASVEGELRTFREDGTWGWLSIPHRLDLVREYVENPEPERKRVYLAGPMRGIERYNFPLFDAVAAAARAGGFDVVSPADVDRAAGFFPEHLPHDFDWGTLPEGLDLRTIIARDLQALTTCNELWLLPGWEKSRGATAERAVALWLGLTIRDLQKEGATACE